MSARRHYQWKLRTLFVAIAVIATLLALRRPYLHFMVLRHEAAKQAHFDAYWRTVISSGEESAAAAVHQRRYLRHRILEWQYGILAEDPFFTGTRVEKPQ